VKRLEEYGGDIRKFRVVKRYPSVLKQIAIAKTEPGDENNQDISSLVGKVDIRKLETFAQDDPDAYSYSGGLCLANQGLLEFVEMFKAPIKVLHPLLTATQEGNFKGTEGFGAIPFDGIVLAHSNESEWKAFRNNKNTRLSSTASTSSRCPTACAFPRKCTSTKKLIRNSSLAAAVCAPGTLKMMAQFAILTRLGEPENSSIFSKMQVYDGDNLKDTDPKAKSFQEYRDYAGVDEGMSGVSTRFAFKILSRVFNFDAAEVAANPVHLMYVLEQQIEREQFQGELSKSIWLTSRSTWRRATPSSSARKSRRPTSSPIPNTARTFSTVMLPTPITGSRTRSIATPTPAKYSTAARSMASWRKSKSRRASATKGFPQRDRQLRAARPAPTTAARTRCGPAMKSCAR